MATGIIKNFSYTNNYGFISRDDGDDVFVHRNDTESGVELASGDRVQFRIEAHPTRKGLFRAREVKLLI
jgi:CspA family cold shock protein